MEDFSTDWASHTARTPSMQKVEDFIDFIREINELLHKEEDLSPANPQVVNRIGRLSQRLRASYSPEEIQAVLNHSYMKINQRLLQHKLSQAEFLAELADSQRMARTGNSAWELITRLPYWSIYISLVSEELSTLRPFIREGDQLGKSPIVFVGSGPMPLSAIILHLFTNAEVICLDINPAACEASCSVLEKLGLKSKVTVMMKNGAEFDYSPYKRIFVASLVQNKPAVLERITRTSMNPLVAVRTAEGMKQIMYEAMDESQLSVQGWRVAARTWPDAKLVINSTLFLERDADTAAVD